MNALNNLGQVKGTLFNERNLGNRVANITLERNKDLLSQVRSHLKDKGFTEAKLTYRAGKYVMTVILDEVDHLGLVCGGYAKPTKAEKKILSEMYQPILREAKEA